MRRAFPLFFLFFCFLVSSCAMQRAEDAEAAQKQMIGMAKEDVFACMGIPNKKGHEGETDIWVYKSGNDYKERDGSSTRFSGRNSVKDGDITDSLTSSLGFSDSTQDKRFCNVQIVMKNDFVKAVHYTGPTGGFMTDDEQCGYAVRNCIKK